MSDTPRQRARKEAEKAAQPDQQAAKGQDAQKLTRKSQPAASKEGWIRFLLSILDEATAKYPPLSYAWGVLGLGVVCAVLWTLGASLQGVMTWGGVVLVAMVLLAIFKPAETLPKKIKHFFAVALLTLVLVSAGILLVAAVLAISIGWPATMVHRLHLDEPAEQPVARDSQPTPKETQPAGRDPVKPSGPGDEKPATQRVAASITMPNSELIIDMEHFARSVLSKMDNEEQWAACKKDYEGTFIRQKPWTCTLRKVLDGLPNDPRQAVVVTVDSKITAYCYMRADKKYAGLRRRIGKAVTIMEALILKMTPEGIGTDDKRVVLILHDCQLSF